MPKTVSRTTARTGVEFQLRDGVPTAIIEVVLENVMTDGRGYAGTEEKSRQVLVLPVAALGALVGEVTGALAYDVGLDPDSDESYNLSDEAEKRFGIYRADATAGAPPFDTFYTLAEARVAAASGEYKGKGFVICRWTGPVPGEDDTDMRVRFATSIMDHIA